MIIYFIPETLFMQLSWPKGNCWSSSSAFPFTSAPVPPLPLRPPGAQGDESGNGPPPAAPRTATNISNLAILQKYIGKKGVAINLFAITSVALLLSFLTDFLYQFYQWTGDLRLGHPHGDSIAGPFFIATTALFILLLLNALRENWPVGGYRDNHDHHNNS